MRLIDHESDPRLACNRPKLPCTSSLGTPPLFWAIATISLHFNLHETFFLPLVIPCIHASASPTWTSLMRSVSRPTRSSEMDVSGTTHGANGLVERAHTARLAKEGTMFPYAHYSTSSS